MPVTTRKKKTTLENNVENYQKKSKVVNVAKRRKPIDSPVRRKRFRRIMTWQRIYY